MRLKNTKIDTLTKTFFSIPRFNSKIHHFKLLKWGIHFWHWFTMPELPSKRGRNWKEEEEVNSFTLLIKSGIYFRNWESIPTYLEGKVRNWLPPLPTNSFLFSFLDLLHQHLHFWAKNYLLLCWRATCQFDPQKMLFSGLFYKMSLERPQSTLTFWSLYKVGLKQFKTQVYSSHSSV